MKSADSAELINFFKFISECIDISSGSALEVNISDLSYHLLNYISTYRTKRSTDKSFDYAISIFATL